MTYTMRFAHLRQPSILQVGDVVMRGNPIGVMGASGSADGAHLHHDAIKGIKNTHWRLADYKSGSVKPSAEQAARVLNKDLFRVYPVVTSAYNDPLYPGGAVHSAFDSVPEDRHETQSHYQIFWPLPECGTVVYSDYDNGYGYSVMIAYDA